MAMDLEGVAPEIGLPVSGFADEDTAPLWLRPYLASAMRRGIVRGTQGENGLLFRPDDPVTGAEAAWMLARTLGLDSDRAVSTLDLPEESVPAWAADAVSALRAADVPASGTQAPLTRAETAELLYRASKLA